jgi:hypothetical protein
VTAILSSILSVFFMVPILGFCLVYLLFRLITKSSRKSVHRALDFSTFLFIISVHFLIVSILGRSLFWLIILAMLVFAIMFVLIHWKVKGEIIYTKVLKGFWRFNFFFFFLAYLTLTIYGLFERALEYTFFS